MELMITAAAVLIAVIVNEFKKYLPHLPD